MGYALSQILYKYYSPSDDIIVSSDAVVTQTNPVYQKKKEFELIGLIHTDSLFRYYFELQSSDGGTTAYGRVYRNGTAIGTAQSTVGLGYVAKTEDIVSSTWIIGDLIQLYVSQAGGGTAYAKNFRLCGSGSEWRKIT